MTRTGTLLAKALAAALVLLGAGSLAQVADPSAYDAALAASLGADERGMRAYVLVILKSGPTPVPAGPARDAMFAGHFANMKRLAAERKLVLAGPLDGKDGRRGLYVFAVEDLEQARELVATDPVVQLGEMTPELHAFYGSAALMTIDAVHRRIAKTPL